MKITEVTEFWFKLSLKLFVKSKSTSENIIYRVVAIVLVLESPFEARGRYALRVVYFKSFQFNMQLILEAKNISLSTAHFSELNRSWKKLMYAKSKETLEESKG